MPDWEKWAGLKTCKDPQLEALLSTVARYLLRFKYGKAPCWLTLMGKVGVGKTHCATKAFNHIAKRSDWSSCSCFERPIYWPEMVESLRSGEASDIMFDLKRWPVVMLDDVFAERDSTGFATDKLNTILSMRVGKWTILTSNLSLQHMAKTEPRIADRIIRENGNCFIDVDTISYGLRKVKENGCE